MEVKKGNKVIKIPDEIIDNYVDKLELTIDEAIKVYLEEEGHEINEEVEELTKKAKDNKAVKHEAKSDRERKKVKKEVVNPDKSDIILLLFNFLSQNSNFEGIKISNPCKLIEFTYKNKDFKIDLIEKRVKKEKNV